MRLPGEVENILEKFKKQGFEAYAVGGCVRDFLKETEPDDWDIATNAKPSEIQDIFPNSFYKNKFFTVTVQTENKKANLKEIEITTFRREAVYKDKRHPSKVKFADTIEQDLARRDFTINAMALKDLSSGIEDRESRGKKRKPDTELRTSNLKPQTSELEFIDPYDGKRDLEKKIIRAVGEPEKRFSEDALRMMRAVRFAVKLGEGWTIEKKTAQSIRKNSMWLQAIAKERIREEFTKIIMTPQAAEGVEMLRKLSLLKYIIPELIESYGVTQNKHHIYDCYEHSVRSLKYAAKKDFNMHVRLAALLHDIGKPDTKRGEGEEATFYGHEIVGAKIATRILNRLKFPKKDIEKIVKLVRYHLFYYNPEEVGESSVRRLVRQVGPEDMDELLQVRMADRIGSGVPKAEPYKLRHLRYTIEKVSQDPISTKMLKVNGHDIIKMLGIKEGPLVGQTLDVLLSMVLSDPRKNKKEILKKEAERLRALPQKELSNLSERARKEISMVETKRDKMTKKKYWIT